MMRNIKYGLTTALRGFEEPEEWSSHNSFTTSSEIEHIADVLPGAMSFRVKPDTKGKLFLNQEVNGDEAIIMTLDIGGGSDVEITETLTGSGNLKRTLHLLVRPGAKVKYNIVQNLDEKSIALLHYEATLTHAKLAWFFMGVGADTTQAFVGTNAGDHSEVINNAVIYGSGQQQFDIHVSTNHVGSHTTSNMLTRSVLDDKARAVYHGLIHIGPEAPECDSYQKDEVILLSDRAGADAIPNLEIQNNKVRCSHGASIGKLDQEKLFYFKSRGVDAAHAKRMITEGFLFSLTPEELHPLITKKAGGDHE